MKLLIVIWSLFLLGLTMVSCSDALAEDAAEELHLHTSTDTENHSDSQDPCTPLCECQCCGVNIMTGKEFRVNLEGFKMKELVALHPEDSELGFLNTLFQPPRV